MLGKTVTIATVNGIPEIPTEDTLWKKPFASEFLLVLKEEWFSSHEFLASTPISDKKYKHPRSKYKDSLYLFNDQFDYNLAYYFAESETTKSNMNKFLTDFLMVSFIKNLSYKNANE